MVAFPASHVPISLRLVLLHCKYDPAADSTSQLAIGCLMSRQAEATKHQKLTCLVLVALLAPCAPDQLSPCCLLYLIWICGTELGLVDCGSVRHDCDRIPTRKRVDACCL